MKRNIYVTASLLALIILTICLRSLWIGFMYFSLSFLIILCFYWFVYLILLYLEDYYYCFDEDFIKYKAELINSSNITILEFEQNQLFYIKKFKKSMRKYKLIDIFKILFLLTVIIIALVSMAKGNFNF